MACLLGPVIFWTICIANHRFPWRKGSFFGHGIIQSPLAMQTFLKTLGCAKATSNCSKARDAPEGFWGWSFQSIQSIHFHRDFGNPLYAFPTTEDEKPDFFYPCNFIMAQKRHEERLRFWMILQCMLRPCVDGQKCDCLLWNKQQWEK